MALWYVGEEKTARYQRSENPWKGKVREAVLLNENKITIAIGANKNTKTRIV